MGIRRKPNPGKTWRRKGEGAFGGRAGARDRPDRRRCGLCGDEPVEEGGTGGAASDSPVPVEAGEVSLKDVPITIDALGTVTPIETIAVQSRVNGQIMKAYFHQGQPVKEGDPLFLIDPRPYQAALDQAKAQLAHDQAVLKEAQTDLARYQTLVAENSIAAQKSADQAFTVQQDEGTVKLDEANVETAQLNLTYAHINSPATGVAGVMQVDPGNYLQAGSGTSLVNITQISTHFRQFSDSAKQP